MSGGGKSAGAGSKSYNYYGSIAALVRCGQTDVLHEIELDGKPVWTGPLSRSTSANPVVITIPSRGVVRYYWGLGNQFTPDPVLVASGNDQGHDHPAYTGKSYIVFENFLFGQERNFANRIKVTASAAPQQTLITGASAGLDSDGQANPYAALAELATNERFGQGLPSSFFSASTWQAAADAARAASNLTYVSPMMTQQKSLKQVADDMLVLCDGWLRADMSTGACEAGLFPAPETITPSSLPLIDSSSIASGDDPSWDPETWHDVKTSWVCTFTDKDKNYKSRTSRRYDDPRALAARSLRDPDTLERPFICRESQAFQHAQRYGRRFSVPQAPGTLPVRRAVAEGLRPGQHIRIDIDPEPGGTQIQQVCRLLSITRPQTGSVKLRVEIEPTLIPIAYTPPAAPGAPPPPAEVPDVAYARFFEVPTALIDGRNYGVGILASRPGPLVIDFAVYYDKNLSGSFPQIGAARSYGLRGKLNGAVTSGATGPFSVDLLDTLNRELIGEDPGDAAARDDTLLMVVLKITGGGQIQADGDDKAWIEIFSCESFVVTGTNQVAVTALRSRQGTPARAFADDDEVWFIRRDALTIVEHADFPGLAATSDLTYFKLQPGTQEEQRPLVDCALRQFTFALNRDTPASAANKFLERRYIRSNVAPPAPTGTTPFGWSIAMPAGSGAIWASEVYKDILTGALIGSWSTPIRISGSITFFQDAMPTTSGYDLQEGDTWFDHDDDNKLYRYDGSAWVRAFSPMLKLSDGTKVYGLQQADGTDHAFVLVADRFQIWNGSSDEVPFEVVGGSVYIKTAFIRELTAAKITSGIMSAASIILSGTGASIYSAGYTPGSAGFIMRGDGYLEIQDALIRGRLQAGAIATAAAVYNPSDSSYIDYTFPATTVQSNSTSTDVSSSSGPVIPVVYNGWKVGSSGYANDRFGRSDPIFLVQFQGVLDHYVTLWYKVDSGSWTYITGTEQVEPLPGYGYAATQGQVQIFGCDGTEVIQFAVRGTNASGTFFNSANALIRGTLSVICFNF